MTLNIREFHALAIMLVQLILLHIFQTDYILFQLFRPRADKYLMLQDICIVSLANMQISFVNFTWQTFSILSAYSNIKNDEKSYLGYNAK